MVKNELIIGKRKQSYVVFQYGNAVWITGHGFTNKKAICINWIATILN